MADSHEAALRSRSLLSFRSGQSTVNIQLLVRPSKDKTCTEQYNKKTASQVSFLAPGHARLHPAPPPGLPPMPPALAQEVQDLRDARLSARDNRRDAEICQKRGMSGDENSRDKVEMG